MTAREHDLRRPPEAARRGEPEAVDPVSEQLLVRPRHERPTSRQHRQHHHRRVGQQVGQAGGVGLALGQVGGHDARRVRREGLAPLQPRPDIRRQRAGVGANPAGVLAPDLPALDAGEEVADRGADERPDVDLLDLAAQQLTDPERRRREGSRGPVVGVSLRLCRHPDAPHLEPRRRPRRGRRQRGQDRLRVAPEEPDDVHRRREGDHALDADATVAGPDGVQAARRRRNAYGSAGVGADAEIGGAPRDGGRGARRRSPGEALGIERVHRRTTLADVADEGVRQLVHLRQPGDGCPGAEERRDDGRVPIRRGVRVAPAGDAEGARVTRDGEEVLERDPGRVQRSARRRPDGARARHEAMERVVEWTHTATVTDVSIAGLDDGGR